MLNRVRRPAAAWPPALFNPVPNGSHPVTATRNGDTGFAASTGTSTHTVT